MTYNIACGDVVPGCATTLDASTEDEFMAKVAEHSAAEHGVTEITVELAGQVKGAITTS